ncbi:hypothetical protein C8R44DRAFT_989431 [Mycena epipterygia]|nr:hypothetical protein C8R44DRAFT_989431 [Mycena epipterygia]
MFLPPEIWLYIHRLATSDTSPLNIAYSDRFQYVDSRDPLKEMQDFLQDAYSFVLVCRLWNSLANEILYENVRVDNWFPNLYAALRRPGTSRLVRSIRLSAKRFDHNYTILALCAQVQIIVLPEALSTPSLATVSGLEAHRELQLPTFHALRHVYWKESMIFLSYDLLRKVLRTSPNLECLFVSYISTPHSIPTDADHDLPAILRLKRLGIVGPTASAFFQIDLQRLTRLNCAPSHVMLPDFPLLPALRTLELFGSRSNIPFSTIFARCPRLKELCYDVWNGVSEPREEQSPLSCIRLHSAVTVIRDWTTIEAHFGLFISPEFPRLQRLVLHGSWHRVVADARFTNFRDSLREQSCQVEFPEGYLR